MWLVSTEGVQSQLRKMMMKKKKKNMKKNKEDEDKKKNFVMIGKLKRG
jgi:hypothetical protein